MGLPGRPPLEKPTTEVHFIMSLYLPPYLPPAPCVTLLTSLWDGASGSRVMVVFSLLAKPGAMSYSKAK